MKKNYKSICLLVLMCMLLAACGKTEKITGEAEQETEFIQEEQETEFIQEAEETEPVQEQEKQPETIQEEEETEPIQEAEEQPAAEIVQEEQPVSPWAGKKVTFCGDSITTFTGYIPEYYSKFYPENGDVKDVNDTWWMQVVQSTGMELCRNASYSGSTVSGQSQDNHEGRYSCGNQRIVDLAGEDGSAPDVIIILMGANDLLNNIPLGGYVAGETVQEGNIETFSEAYALMLDKMKLWYPDAEIYCCTIAEVSRWNEAGEKFPFMNAHSLTSKDYNAWITAIAQAKDVSLIDVYNCGLTFENAKEYTSDGTHPNTAGAKLIADKVCETFR